MVDGKFKTEMKIPGFTHGDCVITCIMPGANGVAAGSAKIKIKKAAQ